MAQAVGPETRLMFWNGGNFGDSFETSRPATEVILAANADIVYIPETASLVRSDEGPLERFTHTMIREGYTRNRISDYYPDGDLRPDHRLMSMWSRIGSGPVGRIILGNRYALVDRTPEGIDVIGAHGDDRTRDLRSQAIVDLADHLWGHEIDPGHKGVVYGGDNNTADPNLGYAVLRPILNCLPARMREYSPDASKLGALVSKAARLANMAGCPSIGYLEDLELRDVAKDSGNMTPTCHLGPVSARLDRVHVGPTVQSSLYWVQSSPTDGDGRRVSDHDLLHVTVSLKEQ